MKKLLKIIGAILAGCCLITLVFLAWYVVKFWPRQAEEMAFGNANNAQKVLIATQGSTYKEAVVARLIEKLDTDTVYVRVTDVSNLETVVADDWADIVILNTSIANKMNRDTRNFLNRLGPSEKVVVITTSGGGDFEPPNLDVDGITTASRLHETEAMANRIFHSL